MQNNDERYQTIREIGRGNFGTVTLVEDRNDGQRYWFIFKIELVYVLTVLV